MGNVKLDIVDFHAHILPCADHGSSSVEMSLNQLRYAMESGVTRIIATPHFYPHRHTLEKFLKRRLDAYKSLEKELFDGAPTIRLGAEVLLCEGFENFVGIDELCISGTKTLLIELPFSDFRGSYCDAVSELINKGYDIVLAHVDRYPKESIESMREVGVNKFQLNAESLSGLFKKKHLLRWIDEGLVVAIGSDIHEEDKKAYKAFYKAINALGANAEYIAKKSDQFFVI